MRKPITWYQLHKSIGNQTIKKAQDTTVQVLVDGEFKECTLEFTNSGRDFYLVLLKDDENK